MRFISILALVLAGCLSSNTEQDSEDPQVPWVRVVEVSPTSPDSTLVLNGVTRASERTVVSALGGGRLLQRPVTVGDVVTEGQVLARLDGRAQRNGVAAAKASLEGVTEQLHQVGRDLVRMQALDERGSVASVDRERLEAQQRTLSASQLAAKAQLAERQRQAQEQRLVAPFSASVVQVFAEEGEAIGPGQPVVALAGSGLEVAVEVPERAWVKLDMSSSVSVFLPALSKTVSGKITSLARAASRQGLFEVVVQINSVDVHAVAGLSAQVTLLMPNSNLLIAPIQVVVDPTGNNPAVFVVHEGVASRRTVQVLELFNSGVSLKGVEPGAFLIVSGHSQLVDGQKVEVMK